MNSDLTRIALGTALALAVPLLTCSGLDAVYPPRDLYRECEAQSSHTDETGHTFTTPAEFRACYDGAGGDAANAEQRRAYEQRRFVATTALGFGAIVLGALLLGHVTGPAVPGLVAGGILTLLYAHTNTRPLFGSPGVTLEGLWGLTLLAAAVGLALAALLGALRYRARRRRPAARISRSAAPSLLTQAAGVSAVLAGVVQVFLGALGLLSVATNTWAGSYRGLALLPAAGLLACQCLAFRAARQFRKQSLSGAATERSVRVLLVWYLAGIPLAVLPFVLEAFVLEPLGITLRSLFLVAGRGQRLALFFESVVSPLVSGLAGVPPLLLLSLVVLRGQGSPEDPRGPL